MRARSKVTDERLKLRPHLPRHIAGQIDEDEARRVLGELTDGAGRRLARHVVPGDENRR